MEKFCWAPWTDLSLEMDGKLRPCCVYEGSLATFRDPDDVEKALKSETLAQVRQAMLQGKAPAGCSICRANEKKNAPSKRLKVANRLRKSGFDVDRLPALNEQLLQNMDLSFSNSCNLVCVMCSAASSSGWRSHEAPFSKETGQTREPAPESFSVPLKNVSALVEFSKNMKTVQILGGEPLLNPSCRRYLEELAKINPDCDLSITTNGTYFDEKAFSILSSFKRGQIDLSVDGVGRVYEYIRGFSFELLNQRVLRACELPSRILVGFHFTLSLYNALNLPDMIRWVESLKARFPHRKILLVLDQYVHRPEQMNVQLLDRSLREWVASELQNFRASPVLRPGELDHVIAYLLNDVPEPERSRLLKQTAASTAYFDRLRGFSIFDAEERLRLLRRSEAAS